MRWFRARAVAALSVAAALTACLDGDGPLGVGTPRTVTVSGDAVFAVEPLPEVLSSVDRARLTITDASADTVIAVLEGDADPADLSFTTTVQLFEGRTLDLRLDAELLDTDVSESQVVFAGSVGREIGASGGSVGFRIVLGRGPLANLVLESLDIEPSGVLQVPEGSTRTITVDTAGAAPGQILYFESSDPGVATVDASGGIKALSPGRALIVVSAGQLADTLDLTVGEVDLPPAAVVESALAPQFQYVTSDLFLGTLSDVPAGYEVRDALLALLTEMTGGRGSEAVGRFEAAQSLWEAYGTDADLRLPDGPQLGVLALTLMQAADVLGIDFPR